ncbi:TetM/TetW/TetO/TetS family tetracycline resistance ribosomal protection protein [Clostridium botulinum D/C]|uniref:GTP-binding protein n=1 Tax=Clostridium botulinum TaxID=1491 RepID=UPI001E362738|nr:TetM/TetW/TetO/TetS family tetracycline resistance ribosomal protection protein [Clostridium botulinum]MCD3351483.1 TetM/TetW/TetO/TetS family tetracycline resistance ribosomal protection protein [Clostridium botulinum D/C]MCD3360439.1 TetM/TetW/TetO/TetS family tetracycline resistance ribosomal protection protein [Clostridium botulinum D/C]MCD3362646.1 TetM/TetW/TetO/TetS family tetracycline resistance ribosomal protection protein [Clostridium botulinum D/C]MCD3366214.1 TetM/TetW/TetO/TetS 
MKNVKNIGIVAHVDGGKTTTTEQIMYLAGIIRELGSVDKGSSKMDYNSIERQRGITIFSEQTSFQWKEANINLIDTPGHIDFSSELERSLKVLDGAILIISAVDGVQAHTETIWNLLRKNNIPTLIFINKLDRVGASIDRIYKDIEKNLTKDYFPIHKTEKIEKDFEDIIDLIDENEFSKDSQEKIMLLEKLAEKDEEILEKYLEGEEITRNIFISKVQNLVKQCDTFPVLLGSAIKGIGIEKLLDSVVQLLPYHSGNNDKEFSGIIYKVKFDESIGKLCYIKVINGVIKIRDSIYNSFGEEEKITQIRKYNGEKYINVECLTSGEIGVVCGLKNVKANDVLGNSKDINNSHTINESALISRVIPKYEEKLQELLKALQILNEEDPTLHLQWNSENKELSISIKGSIHMEVLKEVIKERFNIEVEFLEPKVNYIETVEEVSKGFCHFEPKKHYAEVEVAIEPNYRGKGVEFISEINGDVLPYQYQNNIEKAAFEAMLHGPLIGGKVTDIKIKLINGKYHLEHTHGGDFRIATIRAVYQALQKNKVILLEPVYKYKIIVDKETGGKVMTDILKMGGEFKEPEISEDKMIIKAEVPVATSMNYKLQLLSATSGKAIVNMQFLKFDICHNEDAVLANEENIVEKEDLLYNGVSLFREKKKMKKVTIVE